MRIVLPSPRQVGQGVTFTTCPKSDCAVLRTWPEPPPGHAVVDARPTTRTIILDAFHHVYRMRGARSLVRCGPTIG